MAVILENPRSIELDLHRHLEGTLRSSQLELLAKKYLVPFDQITLDAMERSGQKPKGKLTLKNFITRLSTRWQRLLNTGISINTPDRKVEMALLEDCIYDYFFHFANDAKN